MQNVLADLALENEAAMSYTMRVARALDAGNDEQEQRFLRLATPVGKYWICKRTPNHAYEAMECIGGSGVMEDCIMPRLFRESPVNAIWEGSGNVQCLDTLRALQKSPESLDAFLAEVNQARDLVDRLAVSLQASLLIRNAPAAVADAYCASRIDSQGIHNIGALPNGVDAKAIVDRATPHV